MSFFSDWAESGVMSHLFRSDSMSKPSHLSVAACSIVPVDADVTLSGKEVANAGSYARQVTGASDAAWNFTFSNGSGTVTNASTVTFPAATADWGWVSGAAITTSGVYGGGQYVVGGALAVPKLIGNGDQLKFNAGDLSFSLD